MTLIKSISGIRGTIGGNPGDSLSPVDIVKFISAYSSLIKRKSPKNGRYKVVVGRDARVSGEMVENIVAGTLVSCGIDVVDAGLASTPTTEMAVIFEEADGGVIITASHNPAQWNALKLLNSNGEFLTDEEGIALTKIADAGKFDFNEAFGLGVITHKDFTQMHVNAVLNHPLVDCPAVRKAGFKVVADTINSVGSICLPPLFEALGVDCKIINGSCDGRFAHNPEPLPANLTGLSDEVVESGADLGISVDPDVDRLAFICEDGEPFVEEYTLVAVADYVLGQKPGPAVSNISSSRALADVATAHGCAYEPCKVGEVNATTKMRETGAVIGGEGNGGVIVPDLHYGRDALIGIALFLSHLAHKKMKVSELKRTFPEWHVSKNKLSVSSQEEAEKAIAKVALHYAERKLNRMDGLRVDFEESGQWFILRRSNTEPIIRIYAEARSEKQADTLAQEVLSILAGN